MTRLKAAVRSAVVASLFFVAPNSMATTIETDATGSGSTREDAITAALVSAIQQVTGVAITANQMTQVEAGSVTVGDDQKVRITEEHQTETKRLTNGVVRSYKIVDVEASGVTFVAHLFVDIEKFEPVGGDENRRRIVVSVFAGNRSYGGRLRDQIASNLARARRFSVLDRSNDAAYDREMAMLNDAPAIERVRIGQVLGADYVVVGTIRDANVQRTDRTISLTGERVQTASANVDIDFSVLEIATRQIKWADSVRLGAGDASINGLIDNAAAKIADEITQTIYPMRLIKFDDPGALIVNQGGGTVHSGQQFRAMLLGEPLIDPITKESLGQVEREVGIIVVERVEPKVSYARLVKGSLPPPNSDIILRKIVEPARKPQKPQDVAPPVVKIPGDP